MVALELAASSMTAVPWWRRTQWALDRLLVDDDSVVLGLDVLTQQLEARVADKEDGLLVTDVLAPWVDSYQ